MATVVQTIEDSPSKEAQIIVELMARARAARADVGRAECDVDARRRAQHARAKPSRRRW